jgi:hypothetical protein
VRTADLILACGLLLSVASPASAQTATIVGTVTDAVTHAPLSTGVTVQRHDSTGELLGTVNPNASGQYEFQSVPAGVYFVRIGVAPGYIAELHSNIRCSAVDCVATAGSPVTLAGGATATVDFALDRGGSFTGTVRRAGNNQLLPGMQVQVYNASTSLVTSVATDNSGNYSVDGLPAGSYFARATFNPGIAVQNVLPELYGGLPCPPGPDLTDPTSLFRPDFACRIASGTPIVVTEGATTAGIDFSLDASATITGSVVADGTSAPLAQIPVVVLSGDLEVARGETTSSGVYIVAGLPPGIYRVRTAAAIGAYANEWLGGVCVGCSGTPGTLVVGPGANVTDINFSLGVGGTISGTITCQMGPSDWLTLPVISAYSASGTLVRSTVYNSLLGCAQSNPSFSYQIEGLPPGQYHVLARDVPANAFGIRPTGGLFTDVLYGGMVCMTIDCDVRRGVPVPVTAGATTTGVDFAPRIGAFSNLLPPTPPVRMYDARGVEMVSVVRFGAGFSNLQWVVGLAPGTYFAKRGNTLHGGQPCSAYAGVPAPECPPTSGTPIIIRPGDVSFELNFNTSPQGRRVFGTVSDSSSNPLSTIAVELFTTAGRVVGTSLTDQFGNYAVPSIPPGWYFIRTRNDRGYVDQLLTDGFCESCDLSMGRPFVVEDADVKGPDFHLRAGGVVSGVTTDAAGVAVGGVPVTLFTSLGGVAKKTVSSAAGVFRASVPAGSYRARAEASATHGTEIFSEQPCTSGACDVTAGTPIAVTTGTVTPNVNFTLASCGAMTLSPPSLAVGVTSLPYRQVFSVSGGAGPLVFQVVDGLLPYNLTLASSTGVLTGTPGWGRYAFTVGVVDAAGCATARAYTLDVQECAFTLSPSSATVPAAGGTITITIGGACGSQAVTSAAFVTVQSSTPGQVVLDVPANPTPAPRTDDLTIGRRVFTVRQAGVGSLPPFGSLDAPADGALVSGSIAVGGWALDDLEVRRVQIFRDPVAGEPAVQLFIGTAVFIAGARPDVRAAYPTYPLNDRGGWGFLILTNMLPNQGNGTFRIYAYAEDAEGARTLLGARTIVANNASATLPFGAIDTPGQGETIAGSAYLNWGWALTPQPKIIPTDGSTIQVYVDGVPRGTATYNLFRPDVSGLFPGLANSAGPVGYRVLDTTALAEGQHTIAWVVVDDQGAANGIGSRYFSVANSSDAQAALQGIPSVTSPPSDASATVEAAESAPAIAVIPGPDSGRRAASLAATPAVAAPVLAQRGEGPVRRLPASDEGKRAITLKALERVELTLGDATAACAGTWAGYLVDEEKLADLPVGAAIDPAGTFYWQPGPGFIGTFELLFLRTACDGSKSRVPVAITIQAR